MSQEHRSHFNKISSQWDDMVDQNVDLLPFLEKFGINPYDRVLDVGAGTGRITAVLQNLVSHPIQITAMDIANEMLFQSRKRVSGEVALLCTDICFPGLKPFQFEKIICYSTFPHIKNKQKSLHQLYQLLKPGGKLLIFHTKCSIFLNAFHQKLANIVCADEMPRAKELADMCKLAGFIIVNAIEQPDLYWIELSK